MSQKINITTDADKMRLEDAPLYVCYRGQCQPQPGRLYIEPTGDVTCGINPHVGGGDNPEIYFGIIRTIWLPFDVYGPALADWLDNPATLELLRRVVEGLSSEHDGQRRVGTLTADASEAEDVLVDQAENLNRVSIVEIADFIGGIDSVSDYAQKDIAFMTDAELEALGLRLEKEVAEIPAAVIGNTLRVLQDLRSEAISQRPNRRRNQPVRAPKPRPRRSGPRKGRLTP